MKHLVVVDDDAVDSRGVGSLLGRRSAATSMGSFPLLALSLLIYSGLNLADGSDGGWYKAHVFSIRHMSGDVLQMNGGEMFLSFSMVLLFIEIIRSTRSGGESIANNAFSALVFISAMILFLTRSGYGNSVFLMYTGMTMVDFMAGFMITAACARRDLMHMSGE